MLKVIHGETSGLERKTSDLKRSLLQQHWIHIFPWVAGPLSGICFWATLHYLTLELFFLFHWLALSFSFSFLFCFTLLSSFTAIINREGLPWGKWIVSVSPLAIESSKIWQQTRSKSKLMSSLWWSAPRGVPFTAMNNSLPLSTAWYSYSHFVTSLTFQLYTIHGMKNQKKKRFNRPNVK